MAMPTAVWSGVDSHVNAAHVYVKASNAALTNSLGQLAGGASSNFAAIGLCKVINNNFNMETVSRKAENSKIDIKEILKSRNIDIEIEALIGTNVNVSLANGYIADYTTDTTVPASPEQYTGEAKIFFMKDDQNWNSDTCLTNGGIWFKKCTFIPLGEGVGTFDGSDVKVYKFRIKAQQDASGDAYTRIANDTIIDANALYI